MNEDNYESKPKRSLLGFLFIVLLLVVVCAVVCGLFLLWSVSPAAVLILIGIFVVLGVPTVALFLFVVVVSLSGDDGWSGPGQYFNWDTVPKIRDRWKE